jgi:tetratricopeptide (TPR) repeat protein
VSRPRRTPSVSRHPPRRTRRRTLALAIGVLVLAGGAFAVVRTTRGRAPEPPTLVDLGPVAPEIEDLARQALESVRQEPRDGSRWGRFGMVCEANGLSGAARKAYAAATTLQGGEPKWWFHLASVEARLGDSEAAVRDMRRAIEIDPTFAPAQWRLGLWLLDANQIEDAERAFNHATEIQPFDRAGWIGLARVYLQRGENDRAAGLLQRLAESGGGDRYALQLLATAYRRSGRVDEATDAWAVGARGEPQWTDPWTDEMLAYRRGRAALLKDATALVVAGQFAAAIRILEQLHRDQPDDVVLAAHLGQVYIAAGDEDAGVPLLERVVGHEPDRFEAYVDLATGYMHEGDLAKARAAVERAMTIDPAFAPAHETLGLIRWRGGDSRGAVAAFETAVRLDPRNARALVWMAMVQTNLGQAADALASFQRAARADPTSVDAWIGIANAELSRHNVGAAAVALKNAQQLQPDRPAVKDTARRLRAIEAGRADRTAAPRR